MWKKTYINHEFKRLLKAGILGNILIALMLYADRFIAGMFLGEEAAAAVNLIAPLSEIAMSLGYLVTIGIPIMYCESMGRFDKDRADKILGMGIISAVGLGIINVALIFAVKNLYFGFYGITGELAGFCEPYYNVMAIVAAFMPLESILYDMVLVDGDDKTVVISKIAEGIVKVGAGIILTFSMGIMGLAIGTALGYAVSLLLNGTHLLKKTNSLRFKWYFNVRDLLKEVKFSLVDAGALAFDSLFCLILNKVVYIKLGSRYLIVVAIVSLFQELAIIFDGMDDALEPFVNIYDGQESDDGLRKIMKIACEWELFAAGIMGTVLFILAGKIPVYMGVTDPQFIHICTIGLRLLAISYLPISMCYLLSSYYLFIDHVPLGILSEILNLVAAPLILVLPCISLWGPIGLFIGVSAANLLTLVIVLLVVRIRYGRKGFPLLLTGRSGIYADAVFDYDIENESIIRLRDEVEGFLRSNGRTDREIYSAITLVEELSLVIKNTNKGKKILGECSVIIGEEVSMVFCNNGKIFDLTDLNGETVSLEHYYLNNFSREKLRKRQNLVTMGLNRSKFVLKTGNKEDE